MFVFCTNYVRTYKSRILHAETNNIEHVREDNNSTHEQEDLFWGIVVEELSKLTTPKL